LKTQTENKKSLLREGRKGRLLLPGCKLGESGQLGSGELTEERHSGSFFSHRQVSVAFQSPWHSEHGRVKHWSIVCDWHYEWLSRRTQWRAGNL